MARQIQILSGALLYYGLVLPLSYLPLRILYVLSNLLFQLFCTLVPYRKKVIDNNLALAFPNKSSKEKYKSEKIFTAIFLIYWLNQSKI